MQSVLSGQNQFQCGFQSPIASGWSMGIQTGTGMFLGPPMGAFYFGASPFGDFSTNLLSLMLNNFMQGGQDTMPHCPCDHSCGLYQPYQDMPYGPRPEQQNLQQQPQPRPQQQLQQQPQFRPQPARPPQPPQAPQQKSEQTEQRKPALQNVTVDRWRQGKNDCLESILKNQGFTEAEIYKKDSTGQTLLQKVAKANNLKDPNKLQAGAQLQVPNSPEATELLERKEAAKGKEPAAPKSPQAPAQDANPVRQERLQQQTQRQQQTQSEVQTQVQVQKKQESPTAQAQKGPAQGQAETQTNSQTKAQEREKEAPKTQTKSYDPTKDAGALYKAMHDGITGWGTDEDAIMKTLRGKSKEEIDALKANYKDHYGRELVDDLKGDLNKSEFQQASDLMKGDSSKADARAIKEAVSGFTDDEQKVFDTLKGKSAEERQKIQDEYKSLTGKDLTGTLKSRFSKTEFEQAGALLEGNSSKADAAKLRDAMSGFTDDEATVYKTLEGKSAEERAAIQKEYKALTGKDLTKTFSERLSKSEQARAGALLSGDNSKADAAKLFQAMDGWGTDKKAITEALEGKSAEEREKIAKAFKDEYKIDLDKRLAQDLSGNDLDKANTLLKDGKVGDAKALRHAMEGWGTDEAAVKKVLEGKSKEEIAQLKKDYKAETGKDLEADLKSELDGRDEFDAMQALKGKAENSQEALERLNERHAFEREGLGNVISNAVMDTFSDKGKLLDKNTDRANQANDEYKTALAEGRTEDAKAAKARLDQLMGYGDLDVNTYQEAKDSAADAAGTIAATAASVAVVVATAGTGTPLVAAALAAGGAGAAARTVTTAAISGTGYDVQNIGSDAATGFVDGATAVLGAGAGRAAAAGLQSTRFGGSTLARAAVEGAVDGIVGGAASSGITEAVKDGTWDDGLGSGLARVGMATGMGASMGAVAGGGVGSLMVGAPLVVKAGKKGVEQVSDLAGRGGRALNEMAERGGRKLGDLAEQGGRVIDNLADKGQDAGKKIWEKGKNVFEENGKLRERILNDLKDRGKQGWSDLGESGKKLFEENGKLRERILNDLKDRGQKGWADLGESGKSIVDKFKELDAKGQEAWRKALDTGDGSGLQGKARELWDQANQGLKKVDDRVKGEIDKARKYFEVDDVQPKPVDDVQPKPFDDVQPKPLDDVQPKPVDDVQPKPVDDVQPKPVDDVQPKPLNDAPPDGLANRGTQDFDEKFKSAGWETKKSDRYGFAPDDMHGKEVAFRLKDPKTGEMVEHRGILRSSGRDEGSAIFSLEGRQGQFNGNFIDEMAVNRTFEKKFGERPDWVVKSRENRHKFVPEDMNGKKVSFRSKDPATGEMVEHEGVLKASKDPNRSAMFELEGQKGEFNNNEIHEIAFQKSMGPSRELTAAQKAEALAAKKAANQQAAEQLASFQDPRLASRFRQLEQFNKMEPAQQLEVLSLAKRHEPKQGIFGSLLGSTSPNRVEDNLAKLLRDGKLTKLDALRHESLLDNLVALDKAKLAPGINHKQYFEEVLETVTRPGTISQGNRGTCSATSCQFFHAKSDPSDYVRVATGLGSESGEVTLKSGSLMKREVSSLAPDNSGRRSADRIYQASAMNYHEGRYSNVVRGTSGQGGHVDEFGNFVHDGLADDSALKVLEDVTGVQKESVYFGLGPNSSPEKIANFEKAVAHGLDTDQPVHVTLEWGAKGDLHAYHAVNVERVDDTYVYIRNPWGGTDGQGLSALGGRGLRREAIDAEGRSRVLKSDFYDRLYSYRTEPSTRDLVGGAFWDSAMDKGGADSMTNYVEKLMKLPGVDVPRGRTPEFRALVEEKVRNLNFDRQNPDYGKLRQMFDEVSHLALNFR